MKQLVPVYDTLQETLANTWPMLILFIAIVVIIRISKKIINHERFIFYKELYNLLFIIYLLLVRLALLTPSVYLSITY